MSSDCRNILLFLRKILVHNWHIWENNKNSKFKIYIVKKNKKKYNKKTYLHKIFYDSLVTDYENTWARKK